MTSINDTIRRDSEEWQPVRERASSRSKFDRIPLDATQGDLAPREESGVKIQIEDMARADAALQKTIDALAVMPDLSNFIPAALRIVAEAFDANNCSYYEHRAGDPIRLRYWWFNNHVYSPEEIAQIKDEKFDLMRRLAEGFTVPDSHLGTHFRKRTRASVVDHRRVDPPTTFADFCITHGWDLELNVPLVVAGEADGALIVSREGGSEFKAHEVLLAERLGQQLALAIEASRLSSLANTAAIIRERDSAARQRTEELARHSQVLRQTVDSLVGEEDFLQFIGRLLCIASEQLSAPVVEYWTNDGPTRTYLVLSFLNGKLYNGSDEAADARVHGIELSREVAGVSTFNEQSTIRFVDMIEDVQFREYVESFGMPVRQWCDQRQVQKVLIVPLLRSGTSHGALCIYFAKDRVPDQAEIDLAAALAQQVSLAVRMTELAERSKQTAVSREREMAARDKAAELSRANDVMRTTLEQLSDERDLRTFPRTILKEALQQTGARDGVIFVLDTAAQTLRAVEYLDGPRSKVGNTLDIPDSFPVNLAPLWAAVVTHRAPMVFDVEREGHMLLPGAADWHRGRGNRSVVIAPMFVNGEPYGYFGIALEKSSGQISQVDIGLVQALTQQASLAIQLTRLADESQQAALARVREKDAEERAAEFANANQVLRSMLDQLAGERDLHSFPRTILKEAMFQTGASDGLILVFDRDTDTLNRSEYLSAEDAGEPAPAEFIRPFPASTTAAWNALVKARFPIVFDVELDAALLLPGLAAWHRSRGNRSILAVPMFIDDEPYGYFGITLRHRAAEVSKVSLNLIHALAQQATLAIQLTQLAEASQKAAITLARQQVVVQERAHMAREIHDKLAQGYAAILMQQKALRASIKLDGEILTPHLDIIERLAKDNLAEARRTMEELKVNDFEQGSLHRALYGCTEKMNGDDGFVVDLVIETELPPVARYVETELGRVIGEALSNARRHSRAKSAYLRAQRVQDRFIISVRDEGVGFEVLAQGPSFGIPSMQERAARAGADLEITSFPGQGTEVRVILGR